MADALTYLLFAAALAVIVKHLPLAEGVFVCVAIGIIVRYVKRK